MPQIKSRKLYYLGIDERQCVIVPSDTWDISLILSVLDVTFVMDIPKYVFDATTVTTDKQLMMPMAVEDETVDCIDSDLNMPMLTHEVEVE